MQQVASKLELLKKEWDIVAAVVVGSHLYRLDTPQSDIDLLIVYKPPIYNVLMGDTFKKGNGEENFVKTPGGIEVKLVSLPDFLHRLVNGDMASIEALFGENLHATECWDEIVKLRGRAFTRNLIQKCFGYARNCIHNFTDADGFVKLDIGERVDKCKSGDSKAHLDLVHNHRMLFEIYRYISLGVISFGPAFYDSSKYMKIKSNFFTHNEVVDVIQEMVDIMNMIRERIKPTTFDNKLTRGSFQPVFNAAYGIKF